MHQDLPFADRRQRRATRPHRHNRRYVLAGEKEFFDPASPADFVEYRTVQGYHRR